MAHLIDTDVAIHLRDGDATVSAKLAVLDGAIVMSIITRIELEGGVYRHPEQAALRRARLDEILMAVPALAFDSASADAYASIVAHAGYSRRKILDRMIAAQALLHRSTLITLNGADYMDIPGLQLLAW